MLRYILRLPVAIVIGVREPFIPDWDRAMEDFKFRFLSGPSEGKNLLFGIFFKSQSIVSYVSVSRRRLLDRTFSSL
jgi:hypothetical protein